MLITREDLQSYMYDPNKLQQVILNNLEIATNGENIVTDPTNPFVMLMELAVTSGANSITEPLGLIRQLYPSLAETSNDLYHHLSDNELVNVFSTPAETPLVFYINVKDLYSHGYKDPDGNFVETILPIGTEVVVGGVTFTLLNAINIKLYKEGNVFVEQQPNDETDISIKNLGVLSSGKVNFTTGEPWIVFETLVKQVKKHTINKSITPSEGFDITTTVTKKYYHSDIKYKNASTGNLYVPLNKSHSKDYINKANATCYIEVKDKDIRYKIPDVYLLDGVVSGNIVIEVYETDGNIYLPINKFEMSEFKVSVIPKGTSETEASIKNISILASSRTVLEGGRDALTPTELRDAVITHSTGNIDVPITDSNITHKGLYSGFEIYKALDIITDRVYVASKNLPDLNVSGIDSRPDIFFNTVGLITGNMPESKFIKTVGDYIIIKAGCLFKETDSVVSVVSDIETNEIELLTLEYLTDRLRLTKHFYTPYFYIIDTSNINNIRSYIYNLNSPTMENVVIKAKNNNILPKVNMDSYTIELLPTGYRLYFTLISNDEFKNTNLDVVKAQLSVGIYNSSSNLYFEATYDKTKNLLVFDIETDLVIDVNTTLVVNNGTANITTRVIPLEFTGEIILYTLDGNLNDSTNFLENELVYNVSDKKVIFGKENIDIKLGHKVDYMWNMLYNTYTERKYLKRTYDLIKRYPEDTYELDPDTGAIFTCVTDATTGEITPVYNKTNLKGDIVIDDNGDTVYDFKTGDIILDENGIPTIDEQSGVMRNIDIMMLEYEYKVANSNVHINYLSTVIDTIGSWLTVDITKINDVMLENSILLYRSYKKSQTVTVQSNNNTYNINYRVKPKVKLYVKINSYIGADKKALTNTVANLIHNELNNKDVNLVKAKEDIITTLGSNVIAVKIFNIDTVNDSEVFSMYDSTKRLIVDKILTLDTSNKINVSYDIDLEIVEL